MKPMALLIKLARPATLEAHQRLFDSLENGARGGFNPFGMWDYLIDLESLDWCGVQYYVTSDTLKSFEYSNPDLDRSVIRFLKPDEVFKTKEELHECTKNGVSNLVQVVWSEPSKYEIIPAMEFTDFWYASLDGREVEPQDRFSPSRTYCAVGILGVESKLERMGFNFPHKFLVPFFIR